MPTDPTSSCENCSSMRCWTSLTCCLHLSAYLSIYLFMQLFICCRCGRSPVSQLVSLPLSCLVRPLLPDALVCPAAKDACLDLIQHLSANMIGLREQCPAWCDIRICRCEISVAPTTVQHYADLFCSGGQFPVCLVEC